MNETKLAYLAGFFDADGFVSLYARRSGHELSVVVTQVVTPPLDLFLEEFGGTRCGPYDNGARSKPIYRWSAYANVALTALVSMRPYLVVKGEQADIAIEYRKDSKYRNKIPDALKAEREVLYDKMKSLNQRGKLI